MWLCLIPLYAIIHDRMIQNRGWPNLEIFCNRDSTDTWWFRMYWSSMIEYWYMRWLHCISIFIIQLCSLCTLFSVFKVARLCDASLRCFIEEKGLLARGMVSSWRLNIFMSSRALESMCNDCISGWMMYNGWTAGGLDSTKVNRPAARNLTKWLSEKEYSHGGLLCDGP